MQAKRSRPAGGFRATPPGGARFIPCPSNNTFPPRHLPVFLQVFTCRGGKGCYTCCDFCRVRMFLPGHDYALGCYTAEQILKGTPLGSPAPMSGDARPISSFL